MKLHHKLLVFVNVIIFSVVHCTYAATSTADEPEINHGFQILGKVFRQYLNSQPEDIKLSEGVHLVSTKSENDARSVNDDKTVLGTVENYLQTHELRIKLPELMPEKEFGRAFQNALSGFEGKDEEVGRGKGGGGGGGGGGKGGGGGGILILGLMMAKMMAALGIGGVGLLAMKALMVSALALMLSVIIGLKKLVHSGHDEGHTVIHAHGHGHEYRRKREAANMAYKAWSAYNTS